MEIGTAARQTVLIADDDAQVRLSLRVRLEALGYEVLECCDGLSAIAKVRGTHVDAMILDHDMPLGEGRVVAANIRSVTDAPIIFFSGHSRDEFRDTVMRLADTYYLPKPLDDDRLSTLLKSVIGEARHSAC